MRGQLDLRDVFRIGAILVEDDDLRIGVVAVDLGDDPLQTLMTMMCMMRSPFYALFDFAASVAHRIRQGR